MSASSLEPSLGPMAWPFRPVSDCIEKVDVPKKVQAKSFLDHGRVPIVSQEAGLINGYWDDERDAVRVDSPVVIFGDHTQVLKLVDFDFVVGADGVKVLKPKSFLNASFLKYFLEANPVPSLGYARHFRHISGLSIPLPPLDEQKRIVATLDQAFAALDRARANAEANLADALSVLDESRETLLDPSQPGWSQQLLAELIDVKHGYAFKSEFFASQGDHILLTPGNFHEAGGFRDRGEKQKFYVGEVPEEFVLGQGDLLMAMTEQAPGLLGSCILVPEGGRYLHNQRLGLIVPKAHRDWHAPYFAHVFNLKAFRRALSDTCTGLKVRHTAPARILSVAVPMPPSVSEQRAVAARIDEISASTTLLRDAYKKKLEDISELRESLLQAAFSGQLS